MVDPWFMAKIMVYHWKNPWIIMDSNGFLQAHECDLRMLVNMGTGGFLLKLGKKA
jgi:hypothetical protein